MSLQKVKAFLSVILVSCGDTHWLATKSHRFIARPVLQNRNVVLSVVQSLHGLDHDCLENRAGITFEDLVTGSLFDDSDSKGCVCARAGIVIE